MGTIDKKNFNLICKECEISETSYVREKGSSFSPGNWGANIKFEKFKVKLSGGGNVEPDITSASCINCGSTPTISSHYG